MEIIWKISTTYILGLHGLKVRNITAMRLAQALQRIKLCNTVVVDWDFVYLWCCGDNINQGCPKISNSFLILEGLKILPSVRRCIGI